MTNFLLKRYCLQSPDITNKLIYRKFNVSVTVFQGKSVGGYSYQLCQWSFYPRFAVSESHGAHQTKNLSQNTMNIWHLMGMGKIK